MHTQDPKTLAIRGIRLLEEAIKRDFGLTVQMGAELEFVAHALDGKYDANPLGLSEDGKKSGAPKKLFVNSPFISSEYKETGPRKYELVFHHLRHHGSGVVLARAIEMAKKHARAGAAAKGVEVYFEAIPEPPATGILRMSCALQVNLSLVDGQGHDVLNKIMGGDIAVIGKNMLPVQAETLLLHVPTAESCRRFCRMEMHRSFAPLFIGYAKRREDNTTTASLMCVIPGGDAPADYDLHLENRLAGADADPYQVVLATLAATYHALKHGKGIRVVDGRIWADPRAVEETPSRLRSVETLQYDDVRNAFKKAHFFRDVLNEVSGPEKLGDRFCEAVLANIDRSKPEVTMQLT